ncbi:MAG: hypothetical protein KDA45_15795, partial [Planctomycetales bacterium]|nr:hypothetical protein [Planctomycetales bacterium]
MQPAKLFPRLLLCLAATGLLALSASRATAQEEYLVELRNGMRLGPGVVSETASISTNSFQQGGSGGNVGSKSILILDDGLRLTFVNKAPINIMSTQPSTAPTAEQVELPAAAEAARSGNDPAIQSILGVSEFNKYGRRKYYLQTARGPVQVLQGITLLTPTYAKVEVLRTGTEEFVWDQRIATSSIPASQLREILYQAMDLKKSNDWLRIVSFYMQAERFGEAREVLSEALTRFPGELADRRAVLQQLDQLLANEKFEEIKLRRAAGQVQLAATLLGAFPVKTLSLENQVKLDDEVKAVQQQVMVMGQVTAALQEQVGKLPEPEQQLVAPLVQEIVSEVTLDTVARFADFQRLRNDPSLPAENLVSYALGGWLLGPGAGLDNFAVAKSLIHVRRLVVEYLNDAPPPRRAQILQELAGQEGAQ